MKRTGLTDKQMNALRVRDNGVCVLTGADTGRLVPQHRRNRGMGGDRTGNTLHNTVLLDSILNGLLESDATLSELGKAYGTKVPGWVVDPSHVPVFYPHEHAWFLLEGDTRRQVTAVEAIDRMHEVYGDDWLRWKAVADQSPHAAVYALRGA